MLSKAEIARLRGFREKKHREEASVFVVEGEKLTEDLLQMGKVLELYATPAWRGDQKAVEKQGVRLTRVSESEMERISQMRTISPILALGKLERMQLKEGELIRGLTLALDGVQDAGNVGTLLRIADWYGFDRVLLSGNSADVFSQKVIQASMGSFLRVKTCVVELGKVLQNAGVPVLGADLRGKDVHELPALKNAVLVMGSEGRGLSEDVKQCVTDFVTIPKYGGAESLNVATAAAVICDNLRRRTG